jgi:hypothetical protein
MARKSPAQILDRMTKFLRAWEANAAHEKFFGKTLPEFKAAIQASFDTRSQIADLQRRLAITISRRNVADAESMRLMRGVAYSVLGTPGYGPNCVLYGALGYVRKDAHRKRRRKAK